MKITVLLENTACRGDLLAEHGLRKCRALDVTLCERRRTD